jgi:hypothetical protein
LNHREFALYDLVSPDDLRILSAQLCIVRLGILNLGYSGIKLGMQVSTLTILLLDRAVYITKFSLCCSDLLVLCGQLLPIGVFSLIPLLLHFPDPLLHGLDL